MTPRKRSEKYEWLPKNTQPDIKILDDGTKRLYLRYVFPGGNRKSIGYGEEAIKAAEALNNTYDGMRTQKRQMDAISAPLDPETRRNPYISKVIERFDTDFLESTERNYGEKTKKIRRYKLEEYKRIWPNRRIKNFDTYELAQFLKTKLPEPARQHRLVLIQLFTYAIEEGYLRSNPAIALGKRSQPKRKRFRHTWDGYNIVLKHAPSWLQRTMKQAIYSLQRRGDLVDLDMTKDLDSKAKTIKVLQKKTGMFLLIDMGNELYSAVMESVKSDIPCPYMVHCRQRSVSTKHRHNKPHPFAVAPDYLTRAYKKARDESGAYAHIEDPSLRPAFHDLRALGIFAHFQAGYDISYIQMLAGHADPEMTERYRTGHEKQRPVSVQAGLSLAAIDWEKVDWETPLPVELDAIIKSTNNDDER